MYELTGGKINIAMGSVLGIWHDYREAAEKDASEADNTLPTQEELEAAAQHCDINDLVIDEKAKTVYLSDPEMSLDVGSVGKGYAVEMVCRAAEPGSDQCTGERRRQPARHRHKAGRQPVDRRCGEPVERLGGVYQHQLHLRLAHQHERPCTGDQRRLPALLCGGRQALPPHHDPDTLWPAAYYNGVTVLCPDSGMADCLTTALFCMPLEEGQKLVESLDG